MHAKTRTTRPSAESVTAAELPFPIWKADAVMALARLHERAPHATHDGYWTRLYIRGLDPDEAAMAAAREYDASRAAMTAAEIES